MNYIYNIEKKVCKCAKLYVQRIFTKNGSDFMTWYFNADKTTFKADGFNGYKYVIFISRTYAFEYSRTVLVIRNSFIDFSEEFFFSGKRAAKRFAEKFNKALISW